MTLAELRQDPYEHWVDWKDAINDEECTTMTIDETGTEVQENAMNELTVTHVTRPVLDQENMSMIRTALAAIGNTLVDASQLARDFDELKAEVRQLREETARANHFREIADQAYQQVNAQRIAAETELTTSRFELSSAKADKDQLQFDIQTLNERLGVANGRIAALEQDNEKLVAEFIEAGEKAKVEADERVRIITDRYEGRIATLGEMVRDRDATIADLRSKLDVSERDNRTLRAMLGEARKALGASMAVLEGEMAAE